MAKKFKYIGKSNLTVKDRGTFKEGDIITGAQMDSILTASETLAEYFMELKTSLTKAKAEKKPGKAE